MEENSKESPSHTRALANDPFVILGDEPTGGLDSKSAKKLAELIRTLRRDAKITFILVTHDPIVVEGCDRLYSIRDGKITKEFSQTDINHFKLSHDRDSMEQLLI